MLRRILIIILVAVVIIAAIFAIRWFLNRDSGETEDSGVETVAIVEEGETTAEENNVKEAVVASEVIEGVSEARDETAPVEGSGEAAPAEGSGEAAPAEGSGDAVPAEASGDPSLGGVASGGDANVGGGIPAGSGDAATALGDAVAVEPATGGVGEVAALSPAAAFVQPGVATTHTVENLEWLTQLARCYGTTVADIQAANNYSCPDLIQPGWVVNIANPGNAGPITINDTPCFNYHTVQQGETLYSIATQYGISYQWLARINAIYNYNYIYAGQQLVIPNPVDPVFTQIPAQPFFYSSCWSGNCPVYPVYPIYPMPYGQ